MNDHRPAAMTANDAGPLRWEDAAMGDDIEIQFRGGNPKKWHSGTMRIEGDLLTVTARDGRTMSAQLGGRSPEFVARLLLLELDREKPK